MNFEFCDSMNEIEVSTTSKVLFNNSQMYIASEVDFVRVLKLFYGIQSFFSNNSSLTWNPYSYLTLFFQNIESLPSSTIGFYQVGYKNQFDLTSTLQKVLNSFFLKSGEVAGAPQAQVNLPIILWWLHTYRAEIYARSKSYISWHHTGTVKYAHIYNANASAEQSVSSLKKFHFFLQELRVKSKNLFRYSHLFKDRETIHPQLQKKHFVDQIHGLYQNNRMLDIYYFVQTYFCIGRYVCSYPLFLHFRYKLFHSLRVKLSRVSK